MLTIGGKSLNSRLLLGTANYPSLEIMQKAIQAAETKVITVSITRSTAVSHSDKSFWTVLKTLNCHLLPNTAGCRDAISAIQSAYLSRELFATNWIKLEVIGDEYNLQPDVFELIKAAEILIKEGFIVLPYCTDDLVVCQKLVNLGCQILMPWCAPIGSGKGLLNPYALEVLRKRFSDQTLIIDAGIGKPSHAMQAMELGFDGVLLNTAIAEAIHPVEMAEAFKLAVTAGYKACNAGLIPERQLAKPSTPLIDSPFWMKSYETQ